MYIDKEKIKVSGLAELKSAIIFVCPLIANPLMAC
jgi:hypothetical protein